jgi:putative transposase
MSNYRRANFPGGYYFFTVVTYSRKKIFDKETARKWLRFAWLQTQSKRPFETIALCLLPEHLHCIWKLPENDADFSTRWASIKALFTREYSKQTGKNNIINESRIKHREAAIWQRRFWEHQVRDETDLQNHINYIHYNPVKHGLAINAEDWPWSTYNKYIQQNNYNITEKEYLIPDDINFGE